MLRIANQRTCNGSSLLLNCLTPTALVQLHLPFSTSPTLGKNVAGKWYNKRHLLRKSEVLKLTYDMQRRPHHLGVHKSWLSWHTHNVRDFNWLANQHPGLIIAQEEVIRRMVRAILFDFIPEIAALTELVIKHRGNCVYVSGFLTWQERNSVRLDKLYWLWGFAEELLSNLLKQPVKLELQYVRSLDDLIVTRIQPQ